MKIDLLGPVHPYRGGIAHYTASLHRALSTAGHDVRTVNLRRQYPRLLFPGTTQEDHSATAFDVPSERHLDSLRPDTWLRTGRAIGRRRPDRLVVMWWHPFFAPSFATAARVARRNGVEVVWLCHNVAPHEASRVDTALLRYAYGAADRFIVQAEVERERLSAFLGPRLRDRPVSVCPHPTYDVFDPSTAPGRAEARHALGIEPDAPLVLFFGLIRPYKGLHVLLDAMARASTPRLQLLAVGEAYEDIGRYTQQIANLGLGGRVRLENRYAPNEEVPLLMAAADVVALPYTDATQSGIAQVAYACGRSIITTRVGGIPEVVRDGVSGLLVPPNDADALAAALDRFFADDLRDELERGVEVVRAELGWDRVVEAVTATE